MAAPRSRRQRSGTIDTKPTTFAGATALLRHLMQYEESFAMPDNLEDENGEPRSWNYFLCENLIELLSQAA